MKNSLILKVLLLLPIIIFFDYVLMVIFGCASCLFGFGDNFYCGAYCIVGKMIFGLSLLFFGYLLYPEIVKFLKSFKNATTTEK